MEKINIEELGNKIIYQMNGDVYASATEFKSSLACRQLAEKINEIIDKLNEIHD